VLVGGFRRRMATTITWGAVVMGRDATGLHSAAVFVAWSAGPIRSFFPRRPGDEEGLACRRGLTILVAPTTKAASDSRTARGSARPAG
jgi:hypothetical protein